MNKNTRIKTLVEVVALSCMLNFSASSQNVGINTSGSNANIHAILDLNTGNAGNTGLIIPNVSLSNTATQFNPPMASAPSGGETGMMVYNTNAASLGGVGYYYWNGAQWVSVGGAATANNGLSVAGSVVQLGDPTTATFPTTNLFSVGREVTENGFPMIFDVGNGAAGNNAGNWSIQNNVGAAKNPAFFVGYNANGNPAVEIGNAAAPANILFNVQANTAPAAQGVGSTVNIYGQNASNGKGGQVLLAAGTSTGNTAGANIVLQPSPLSGSSTVNGSVSMNMYGTAPNASAFVDMSNTNGAGVYGNKGMLVPEITSATNTTAAINAIIPGAAVGLLVFNVGTGCFLYYAGGAFGWMEMFCPCNAPPALTAAGISGCTAVAAGATGIVYSVTAPQPGVSYNWSINNTNGTITSATFGTSITVTWNALATGSSNVVVTANNSCGANTVNYPVTIANPVITGPVGNIAIPQAGTGPYAVTAIGGATYAWTFVTGAGTFTAPASNSTNINWTGANSSSNQAKIQCVITLPGGCGSVTSTYIQTFHGTVFTNSTAGGPYTVTVPNGITLMTVVLNGAMGGSYYDNNVGNQFFAGWGATVTANLTTVAVPTFTVFLGGVGGNPASSIAGGAAGSGGPGSDEVGGAGSGSAATSWALNSGYGSGGGGGGASSIRLTAVAGGQRYLVAGGGGGAGGNQGNGGGGGGITVGQGPQAGQANAWRDVGGNPGTAGSGGAGVTGGQAACIQATTLAGGVGIGSAGVVAGGSFFGNCEDAGGGGGGGGWWSGSGGAGGGGGGGYSASLNGGGLTFAITNVVANNNNAAGSCTVTY